MKIAASRLKSVVSHDCERYAVMYSQSQSWENISHWPVHQVQGKVDELRRGENRIKRKSVMKQMCSLGSE